MKHQSKSNTSTSTSTNDANANLSVTVQVEVKPDARDAYAESLKMILQHVADFHLTVVDIISEKYKIPVGEIMNAVTLDSRYVNMFVDPKIHHLNSSSKQNHVEVTETIITETPISATVTKKTSEKKIKIKPKNSIIITSATS
jgi:hypothetical protein